MTDFPFAIVGFDMDGTLLDTSGDLAAAVNHALVSAGRPALTAEQVRPMIGGGGEHMLGQALAATGGCDEGALRGLYERLLAYYEAHLSVHTRPFPGVLQALDDLAARGVTLAIATNKREALAVRLLAELNLSDRFACVIGGDTLGPGNAKPSPVPIHEMIRRCGGGRAAFVGDSIFDMEAARNAGIPGIAVSFGYLTGSLDELRADAVIDAYADLVPTLSRLSG